jgi:hypothetical protein
MSNQHLHSPNHIRKTHLKQLTLRHSVSLLRGPPAAVLHLTMHLLQVFNGINFTIRAGQHYLQM